MSGSCVVLYSGGTDSTCVAALLAERFREIHLLTFYERGTEKSAVPRGNVEKLRQKFPLVSFVHELISTDRLVEFIAYENYPSNLRKHGLLMLSMPGFSTLSWHVAAILYCRKRGIRTVADGLTRELMHFPGHMDELLPVFRRMYQQFSIGYENPVRSWDVPPDVQFIEKLLVDFHTEDLEPQTARTTGKFLFDLGIFREKNLKGTRQDREMQHDCYPFVLFNMMVFWIYLPLFGWGKYERAMRRLFEQKTLSLGEEIETLFQGVPRESFLRCIDRSIL